MALGPIEQIAKNARDIRKLRGIITDDVLEFVNSAALPAEGKVSKIYITLDENKIYRWTGTEYQSIGGGGDIIGKTANTGLRLFAVINSLGVPSLQVFDTGDVNNYGPGGILSNTVYGTEAFRSNTSGTGNTVIGYQAGNLLTTATDNVVVGRKALMTGTIGSRNVAIGPDAMRYGVVTGNENVAIGYNSMRVAASARWNVAIGLSSLNNVVDSAEYNTAVGVRAMSSYTGGSTRNTGIGYQALPNLTTGGNNTGIGTNAGGGITTGSGNTIIGSVGSLSATLTNTVAIGDGSGNLRVYIPDTGNVLIGTSTDVGHKLRVNGSIVGSSVIVGDPANPQGTITAGQLDINYPNFIRYQSAYYFTITPKDNSGTSLNSGGYVAIKGDTVQLLHDNLFYLFPSTLNNSGDTVKLKRGSNAGHIPLYLAIEGSDAAGYNYGTKSGSVLIYPGEQSFGNGYGAVVLGHTGTAARGNVGIGTSSPQYLLSNTSSSAPTGYNGVHTLSATGLYWKNTIIENDRYVAIFENTSGYGNGILVKTSSLSHSNFEIIDENSSKLFYIGDGILSTTIGGFTANTTALNVGGCYSGEGLGRISVGATGAVKGLQTFLYTNTSSERAITFRNNSSGELAAISSTLDDLNFYTKGATGNFSSSDIRMRIASTTGNVLIGTTTDNGYKLNVNGSINIAGGNKLNFSNGSAQCWITNEGLTGLGSRSILIPGTGGGGGFVFYSDGGGPITSYDASGDSIQIRAGSSAITGIMSINKSAASGYGGGTFIYYQTNSNDRMYTFGNPNNERGDESGTHTKIAAGAGGFLGNGGHVYLEAGAKGTQVGSVDGNIIIGETRGNVGVGTATMSAKFHVKGTGSTSATSSLLVQNSSGVNALNINDAANVLIGTTTDAGYKLDVNGTARVAALRVGDFYASGVFSAGISGGGVIGTLQHGTAGYGHLQFIRAGFAAGGIYLSRYENYDVVIGAGNYGSTLGIAIRPAQIGGVKIGGDNTTVIHVDSAILNVESTTKGVLFPRMTTPERVAIASPANGLIVFDTDVQNLCYRRDNVWVQVAFNAV